MTHKVTVGLQQKVGQPNYGSLAASCSLDVALTEGEVSQPGLITEKIEQAFAMCRRCIEAELNRHHRPGPKQQNHGNDRGETLPTPPRPATGAQVRAIQAIAAKAGIQLASELTRFGVSSPHRLSLSQASRLIDELKSQQTPAS